MADTMNHHSEFEEHCSRAKKSQDKNDWGNSIKEYERALEIIPDDKDIIASLGFCYSRNRDYKKAIKIFLNLMNREPEFAKWPYMAGYQYYVQSNWTEAIIYFDKSLALKPDYLIVLYRQGYAFFKIDERKKAIECFKKYIAIWSNLEENDYKDRNTKKYSDSCFQLGKIYLDENTLDKAIELFKEAVKYDLENEHKHYNLGKAYLKANYAEKAVEELEVANKLHHKHDYFQDKLAIAYTEMGDYDKAEKILVNLIRFVKKDWIYRDLAIVYHKKGRLQDAEREFKNALRKVPDNHKNHYFLGLVYVDMEDWKSAEKEFKAAIGLKERIYGLEYLGAEQKLNFVQQKLNESENKQQN